MGEVAMRAVVIGATGHVGSYTVPTLVRQGYKVTAISRGKIDSYTSYMPEWKEVEIVHADRLEMENNNAFGEFVMNFKPDIICDLICYTLDQAKEIAQAAKGKVSHYIQIGSLWIYEYNIEQPVVEGHEKNAVGKYGHNKALIEDYLLTLAREENFPATVLHPGHIVGREWIPVNPQANFDLEIYKKIAQGQEIILPDFGTATLHHVHSQDIADQIIACLKQPEISIGNAYHSASSQAVTLRGFAEHMYKQYNHTPNIKLMPWNELKPLLSEEHAAATETHISHSPCASMEKSKDQLGFVPRYSSFAAVEEAVDYLLSDCYS